MLNYKDTKVDIFDKDVYVKLCSSHVMNALVPTLVVQTTPINEDIIYRKPEPIDKISKFHWLWDKNPDNIEILSKEIEYTVQEDLSEDGFNTLKEIVLNIVIEARQMLGI